MPSELGLAILLLRKWSKPNSGLYEGTMEALILADLCYRGLGWSPANAQAQLSCGIGYADIVLKPNLTDRSKWIVVEVKAPSYDLKSRGSVDAAIRQVTNYAVQWRASRCIVTNGRIWWFLAVCPQKDEKARFAKTVTLVRFDIERDRQLALAILRRCTRASIGNLFQFLEARFRVNAESELLRDANRGPFVLPIQQRWEGIILRTLENPSVYLRTILKPWREVKIRLPA